MPTPHRRNSRHLRHLNSLSLWPLPQPVGRSRPSTRAVAMQHTLPLRRGMQARLANVHLEPAWSGVENRRRPVAPALECEAEDRLVVTPAFVLELAAAEGAGDRTHVRLRRNGWRL